MKRELMGVVAAIVMMGGVWTWSASAQEAPGGFEYCTVVGAYNLAGKVKITIDYGEGWTKSKDEAGKVEKFVSMTDAVNEMATNGWELHSTFSPLQNVSYFIMKRPRK